MSCTRSTSCTDSEKSCGPTRSEPSGNDSGGTTDSSPSWPANPEADEADQGPEGVRQCQTLLLARNPRVMLDRNLGHPQVRTQGEDEELHRNEVAPLHDPGTDGVDDGSTGEETGVDVVHGDSEQEPHGSVVCSGGHAPVPRVGPLDAPAPHQVMP